MAAPHIEASPPSHAKREPVERELVRAAQAREPGSREALVDAFAPLIASIARRYHGSHAIQHAELMQEGVAGLLRALERYDPTLGTPFWAYAVWWVRQAMQQLVSELAMPVVLSDRAVRQLARVKRSERDHLQRRGRHPTLSELALGTGLSRQQVQSLVGAERTPRALDQPLRGDRPGATFGDLLVDPSAEDALERVPTRLDVRRLDALLACLTERERRIMRARYGLDGPPRTLQEIAGTLGLSAERVRQLERRALDKLREAAMGRPV